MYSQAITASKISRVSCLRTPEAEPSLFPFFGGWVSLGRNSSSLLLPSISSSVLSFLNSQPEARGRKEGFLLLLLLFSPPTKGEEERGIPLLIF